MAQSELHSRAGASRRPFLILLIVFLLTLPLLNPWVRGDGVGYYALARAPLIQHNLDFREDFLHANASLRARSLEPSGQINEAFLTPTGHISNHFSVGPAILWSPFLLVAHGGVLVARAFGSAVAADGFSSPYRIAMALGTAFCGFLGLWIAFCLARIYVEETWALIATFAVWFATSLPVYMYFNPSWSHAHSAFVVALFVWYWHGTRESRSLLQWLVLGAIAGLMLNVYYPNAMVMLGLLGIEALDAYATAFRGTSGTKPGLGRLLLSHAMFAAVTLLCLLPSFLTRAIIFGSPFASGYIPLSRWNWTSPSFVAVLFSSEHGLLSWTPLILLSFIGLAFFWRQVPRVGSAFLAAVIAFYYFIASYPDWTGISSFGNRFFVSLTVFFVLGLAILLQHAASLFHRRSAAIGFSTLVIALFSLWNWGLIFQWGSHLIPARGPVSWSEVCYNQFAVVPHQLSSELHAYLFHRKELMHTIEQRDIQQLEKNQQ
jgi:hypothetical protein